MHDPAGKTLPFEPGATALGPGSAPPVAQDPEADDPRIGAVLKGCYRIERRLGAGGMGSVYVAEHTALHKRVAVKILAGEYTARPELKERFLREARAAAAITDDHVIEIHDFGETPDGAAFFVMEYLQGEDLAELIRREAPLPWPRARAITLQLCAALQAAHARGIVHRDMKPANCFRIERPGPDVIKVLDFGIAKIQGPDEAAGQGLTRTGMIFGTPEYMSPEQARGARHDHRVDVYATGVILFELLTGRTPFVADTFMGLLNQHMFEAPPRPSELAPRADIPAAAEAVVLKALQKDPDLRFESMDALAAALTAVDAGVAPAVVAEALPAPPRAGQATTFRAPGSTEPPLEQAGRRGVIVLLSALLLAGVATIAFMLGQDAGDDPEVPAPAVAPVAAPLPPLPAIDPPVSPPPPPAPDATVTLRIDTDDVAAQVLDEDGAVLGNTADDGGLSLPRGPAERLLRLRADGFQDTLVKVTPDTDRTLSAAMLRLPEPGKPGKAPRPGARPKDGKTPPPPPTETKPGTKPSSPDLLEPF